MNVGELVVKLRVDLRNFTAGMTKATGLVRTFASRATVAFRQLAHSVTRWMRRIAIVIVATLTASIRELAKFEEQLANVSTMLDDHTMHLMPRYAQEMRRMSVQFGESTATISKGLYDILSASVAPAQALGVLNVSMKAATAGLTDTAVAADVITTALNSYGYEAKYAGLISDRLFAIVKRGKTTFAELASSMGTVLPNAALVGAEIETIGAALSTATRSGVSMGQAVTDLNFLITSFLKPTDSAADVARQYGIELKASTLRGNGLLDVLRKLQNASAEDIAAIGQRRAGMRALSILVQHASEVERDYEEALNSTGITQVQYEKVTGNLMFKLRQFWQLLKDIMVNAVQPFADDLKALIDYTIRHRDEIVKWVSSVTGKLDEFVEYLQRGFADGAKVGFAMLKEIARTTGEALLIIFEETFVSIGVQLPAWLWKGIKLGHAGAKQTWKRLGTEIGAKFAEGINEGLNWLLGTDKFGQQLEANLAQLRGGPATLGERLGPRLSGLYADLENRLEAIRTKTSQLTPEMRKLVNEAKRIGGAFADAGKMIWNAFTGLETQLPKVKAAGEDAMQGIGEVATKWEQMWKRASGAIAGAIETAFADIVENVHNATEAVTSMLKSIQRAISQAIFQQYLFPGVGSPTGMARGGLVYAANGAFRPRGSDTVPAMLTPGELVVDKETTSRLRQLLGAGEPTSAAGQNINIHVHAIDAAGTYQFLQKNKRHIASMLGETQRGNHPIRRGS
jgi:TP901 family phage tail tape measure protein